MVRQNTVLHEVWTPVSLLTEVLTIVMSNRPGEVSPGLSSTDLWWALGALPAPPALLVGWVRVLVRMSKVYPPPGAVVLWMPEQRSIGPLASQRD